ncbi:MAG: oligoendopeptidase F [Planctomycetes bacterium]|nr:oligoendopeptidase F [Planctomycetota bacterium]
MNTPSMPNRKGLLLMAATIAFLSPSIFSADRAAGPAAIYADEKTGKPAAAPTRDQIAEKDKWNLADIFANDAAFEEAFKKAEAMIPEMKALQGTLGKSGDALLAGLQARDRLGLELDRLAVFAGLSFHQDMAVSTAQARDSRVHSLGTKAGEAASWFVPELLTIPWESIEDWMAKNKELAAYRHALEDIQREKAHYLSPREEELLAMAGEITSAPNNIYSLFTNTDMDFPVIKDENDRDVKLSAAAYSKLIYSRDRRVRRDAFMGIHDSYSKIRGTLGAMLTSHIKQHIFTAKARHYGTAMEAALGSPNIPTSVYENLVETVGKNTWRLHEYVAMRKKMMKLDEIHGYDLYVQLVDVEESKIKYEDAIQTILTALAPLGTDYTGTLKKAFDDRWIDVYETKGKRSGAYCWGSYLTHPYLLLNYGQTMNDRSTIAHEMGHAMHSWYTVKNQPPIYGDYATFCAEVASTVNEVVLAHYLLENAKNDTERLLILQQQIEGIRTTVFRQTMFAEFEMKIHALAEGGEPLTGDRFCEIYGELVRKYYGPELVIEPSASAECLRIPHFYRNFYVYTYATSHCAATNIGRRITDNEPGAVEGLMKFLASGSSRYPIETLQLAGVDMSSPKPVTDTMEQFSELLREFEALYNKQPARVTRN